MILRRRRPLLTDTLPSSASTPRLRCKTTRTAGPSLARPAHTSRCNLSPAHSATPARRGRAESQRECTRGKEQSPSPWRGHRERCRHPHLHHGPALGVWEYPIGGHHSRLRPPATLAHRPARKGLPRTSRAARRARRATCASGSPPCACGAWPATGNFEAGRAPRDLAPAHRNLRHRRPGARGQAPSIRAGRVLSCLSGPPITLGAEQATRPGLPTGRVPVPVTQRHRHRRFEPCFGDLPRSAHSYGTDHSAPHPAPQARTDRITCCPATDAFRFGRSTARAIPDRRCAVRDCRISSPARPQSSPTPPPGPAAWPYGRHRRGSPPAASRSCAGGPRQLPSCPRRPSASCRCPGPVTPSRCPSRGAMRR